jgi:hypothetical protein
VIPPATTLVNEVLADIASGEEPIPLTQLPSHSWIPKKRGGRKPDVSGIFRWSSRGLRGHRLETIRCGGAMRTTPSAVLRFYARLSGAGDAIVPRAGRARAMAWVEQQLEKEGL